MSDKRAGADTAKSKMRSSEQGKEFDGEGNIIPIEKRASEDRAKAIAAGETPGSVKNPEQEAERPAPMPRDQQGQGGQKPKLDPAGQQRGQRR